MSERSRQPSLATRGWAEAIRDYLLYVAVAIAFFGSIALYAYYQQKTHAPPGLPLKWLGFGAMTALVFGDAARSRRAQWSSARFWLVVGSLLVAQLVLGALILQRISVPSTMVWAILIPIDYLIVEICVNLFLNSRAGFQ